MAPYLARYPSLAVLRRALGPIAAVNDFSVGAVLDSGPFPFSRCLVPALLPAQPTGLDEDGVPFDKNEFIYGWEADGYVIVRGSKQVDTNPA